MKKTNSQSDNIDSLSAYKLIESCLNKIDNKKYGIGINPEIISETASHIKLFLGVSQQQNFLQIQHKLYGGVNSPYDIIENKKQDMIAFVQGCLEYIKEHGIIESPVTNQPRVIQVDLSNLHPVVQETAGKLFNDGHYRQAILDTYIALVEAVQKKSGKYNLDNTSLMQTVFSQKNRILSVSEEDDEQLGFMWLYTGAVMGIRNPKAHHIIKQHDPQRALEWLSFASVLLRVLDDSKLTEGMGSI